MDYLELYDRLYKLGYHGDDTNSGLNEVSYIVHNYQFEYILDVGCSQGKAVEQYKQHGKKAYGIDVSPTAIQLAHKNELFTCVQSSILDIPFNNKSFDAVVSTDVLEHLQPSDIDKALSELIRVSKKYLFLRISKSVEGRKDWINRLKQNYPEEYKEIDNLHLSVFPPSHWRGRLEIKGCTFIEKKEKLLVFQVNNDSK